MSLLSRTGYNVPCAHMYARRPRRDKVSRPNSLPGILKAHSRKLQALDWVQVANTSCVTRRACCQADLYVEEGVSRCADMPGEE